MLLATFSVPVPTISFNIIWLYIDYILITIVFLVYVFTRDFFMQETGKFNTGQYWQCTTILYYNSAQPVGRPGKIKFRPVSAGHTILPTAITSLCTQNNYRPRARRRAPLVVMMRISVIYKFSSRDSKATAWTYIHYTYISGDISEHTLVRNR